MSRSASPSGMGIVATDRQSVSSMPGGPGSSRPRKPPAAAAVVAQRTAESLTLAAASELAMGGDGEGGAEDAGWLRHAYWERVGVYRFPTEHEGVEWPGLVVRATLREDGELAEEAYFAVFADEDGDLSRAPLRGLPDVATRLGPGLAEHLLSGIGPLRADQVERTEEEPAPATRPGAARAGSRRKRSRSGPRGRNSRP